MKSEPRYIIFIESFPFEGGAAFADDVREMFGQIQEKMNGLVRNLQALLPSGLKSNLECIAPSVIPLIDIESPAAILESDATNSIRIIVAGSDPISVKTVNKRFPHLSHIVWIRINNEIDTVFPLSGRLRGGIYPFLSIEIPPNDKLLGVIVTDVMLDIVTSRAFLNIRNAPSEDHKINTGLYLSFLKYQYKRETQLKGYLCVGKFREDANPTDLFSSVCRQANGGVDNIGFGDFDWAQYISIWKDFSSSKYSKTYHETVRFNEILLQSQRPRLRLAKLRNRISIYYFFTQMSDIVDRVTRLPKIGKSISNKKLKSLLSAYHREHGDDSRLSFFLLILCRSPKSLKDRGLTLKYYKSVCPKKGRVLISSDMRVVKALTKRCLAIPVGFMHYET
ncbi:MAG: hypothetical protein WC661_01395 [Opitutaceae bacterium]|jgi:hypothetical protein